MNFTQFIKSEWENAFNEGFAFLKKIPSSDVLSMISLCSKYKDLFTLEFLEKQASDFTSIPEETHMKIFHMQNQEKISSFEFNSVNDIKLLIKNRLSICKDNEEREILEKAQAAYEGFSTPKAKETRKVFFPRLEDAFKSKPRNDGGGCWSIPTPIDDRPMELTLDFGGRFSTIRYWIDVFPDMKPEKIVFISYEEIMGFSEPDWDLMRSDLLDKHADVFVEVVQRTIKAISDGLN